MSSEKLKPDLETLKIGGQVAQFYSF